MNTKYKGKNIRVSDEHHTKVIATVTKKEKIGAWVEDAIDEKIERDKNNYERFNLKIETK
jgi:hypothetical protein